MSRVRRERLSDEDRAVWAAFARGEIAVTASPAKPAARRVDRPARRPKGFDLKLDLHGLTQAEAHRRLARVFEQPGLKRLLIVTGRGLGKPEGGILKAAVPRWLREPFFARRVIGVRSARPEQGGTGALCVELRRTSPMRQRDR